MRILPWFRRKETPPPPKALEVFIGGEVKRLAILGARGVGLLATDGRNPRLVLPHMAVDKDEFWRAHKHYRGGRKLTWEDGTPFEDSQ